MAKIEKDSLEGSCRNYLHFVRSTSISGTRKEKAIGLIKTRQVLFGFNRKQDNVNKTKQLSIWDQN